MIRGHFVCGTPRKEEHGGVARKRCIKNSRARPHLDAPLRGAVSAAVAALLSLISVLLRTSDAATVKETDGSR